MECNKSISNREVYSDTSLPQQTRKISNKQPKLTSKATRENIKNKNRQTEKKKKQHTHTTKQTK